MPKMLALLALLLASRAIAAAPEPGDVDTLYRSAEAAFAARDWPRARTLLEEANLRQVSALFVFNIARTYQEEGRYQEAYDTFLRAATLVAESPPAHRVEVTPAKIESRLAALAERIARAWLVIEAEAGSVQIDDTVRPLPSPEAIALTPGAHLVCHHADAPAVTHCRVLELPRGRVIVAAPDEVGAAHARWSPLPGVRKLQLDGVALLADWSAARILVLAPGRHLLTIAGDGVGTVELALELWPGADVELAPRVRAAWATAEPTGDEGAGLAPWLVIGAGAVAAVIGAVFLADAASRRDRVESAQRDDQGAVTGLSQPEARSLLSAADDSEALGWGLGVVGLVGLGVGVTWLVLDQAPPGATSTRAFVVRVGGRF